MAGRVAVAVSSLVLAVALTAVVLRLRRRRRRGRPSSGRGSDAGPQEALVPDPAAHLKPPRDSFMEALTMQGKMGLKPCALQDWFRIDDQYEKEIGLRKKLMAEQRADVIGSLPQADEAACEALAVVVDHLLQVNPDIFGLDAAQTLHNRVTGDAFSLEDRAADPLRVLGSLVQEDCAIMLPHASEEGGYILGASVLCFPTHWRLGEKLGKPMAGVHEPVAVYPRIRKHVNRVFETLSAGKMYQRFNWTIHVGDALFIPYRHRDFAGLTPETAGSSIHLRSERQTICRLPCGAVFFTIKIYQRAVAALRPEVRAAFADLIRALPPSADKGRTAWRQPVLDHLASTPSRDLI